MDKDVAAALAAIERDREELVEAGAWQERWGVVWHDDRLIKPLPDDWVGLARTLVDEVPERLWRQAWMVPGLKPGQSVPLLLEDVLRLPEDALLPPGERWRKYTPEELRELDRVRAALATRWSQLCARDLLFLHFIGSGSDGPVETVIFRSPLGHRTDFRWSSGHRRMLVRAVAHAIVRAREGLPPDKIIG